MGIGDWAHGDWAQSPNPTAHNPNPKTHILNSQKYNKNQYKNLNNLSYITIPS